MAGINIKFSPSPRLCEVDGELGYFHLWEQWASAIDASPLHDGYPAGLIGQVYGVVEFKDGIRRVDPTKIKFCDEESANLHALVKYNEALKKENDIL